MMEQVKTKPNVAVVGLGAMGRGVALRLAASQLKVAGYDLRPEVTRELAASGVRPATSIRSAAEGADILVVMVVNAAQVEDVLFGSDGAVEAMAPGSTVMVCSTIPPSAGKALAARVEALGRSYIDAPVSGGVVGASSGTLTVMASGSTEAISRIEPVLEAMAGKVYRLGPEIGIASTVKAVNQLLAGIHIAAAAEAIALGVRAGLDPRIVFDVVRNSAGASWMLNDRVPRMLEGDYTARSAVNIFVKDLGVVLQLGEENRFPLPLASCAHQLFLMAAGAGFGEDDDSSVVRIYEQLARISVSGAAAGEPTQ